MIIDTTGPVVSFVTPTDGVTVGPSEFTARWTASDALSSIARYEISFDGGSFADVGVATSRSYANVSDGPHSIVVRAYDSLGNMGEIRANFFVGVPPAAGFPWWILAVILAALLGVLFFLLWKRRKDEEEDALAKAAEAGAAPAEVAEEPPIPSPLPPDPLPEPAPPPPEPDPEIRLEPPTPPL
jgi:LPXTG-motif cell wall-anchored protein